MTSSSSAGAPAIQAENLEKRFGDVRALCGVSFEVPTGTVLGLLGPNGAGKTTAVRILTTLMRADGGSARVLGIDVAEQPRLVRAGIGLTGQFAAVDDNLTGRENLRLVGKLTHMPKAALSARADELLARFNLVESGDRMVRTYSGGMRRRLDLAAALVHSPPVLFLDEPTTGLDPRSRAELWEFIEEMVSAGTTLLLTTQYLDEAERLADRLVVIDHGSVIAEGTATELKTRLGSSLIEISFASEEPVAVAAGKLGPIGDVTVDGRRVELRVRDGAAAMLEAVRALDAERLEPQTMALREPTLDDVFLSLTGHAAEEDDDDETPPSTGRKKKSR